MDIRQATPADVPEVRHLQVDWAAEHITRGYAPNDLGELTARVGGCFFVAAAGRDLVGFVLGDVRHDRAASVVVPPGDRYVEIADLYVAPAYRSAGVGRRLVDTAAEWARGEGISVLVAYSATRDLDRVLQFYRSAGFEGWAVQVYRDLRTGLGQG